MSDVQVLKRPGLAVASLVLIAVFCLPIAGWFVPGTSLLATIEREGIYWIMAAVVIAYILLVERRPLSSIGLHRLRAASMAFGALGGVCAFAGMALLYVFVLPRLTASFAHQTNAVLALPTTLRIEIVVRAAVFEEIFYRGFMIERLSMLLRSRAAAAGISLIAFTGAHVGYWGVGSVVIAGFGGLVLTGLYLWKRDLVANIVAHGLTDAAALLA